MPNIRKYITKRSAIAIILSVLLYSCLIFTGCSMDADHGHADTGNGKNTSIVGNNPGKGAGGNNTQTGGSGNTQAGGDRKTSGNPGSGNGDDRGGKNDPSKKGETPDNDVKFEIMPNSVTYKAAEDYVYTCDMKRLEIAYDGVVLDSIEGEITWTSSNPEIVSIYPKSNSPVLWYYPNYSSEGTTVITATGPNGETATAEITVVQIERNKFNIIPGDATLTVGDQIALSTDAPSSISINWSTFNNDVISIDSNGVVTAIGCGTAYVWASADDPSYMSATATIAVLPAVSVDDPMPLPDLPVDAPIKVPRNPVDETVMVPAYPWLDVVPIYDDPIHYPDSEDDLSDKEVTLF